MEARRTQLLLVSLVVLFLLQTTTPNVTAEPAEPPVEPPQAEPRLSGKHIVLVHGACLGAWSWFKLIPLLRSSGYKVTAFDLAASGIDPRQFTDIPLIDDYFQPLRDFMASLPPQEKVVLVGHSMGGLAISDSMELFPEKISVAVCVTCIMPGPTYNISTLYSDPLSPTQTLAELDNKFIYGNGTSNPPTAFILGPKHLRARLLQLSPIQLWQDWVLATLLVRYTNLYSDQNIRLTTARYGSVKRVFIIAGRDKTIIPAFQRIMIENNPPTEVQEIATSDHMVMNSKTTELSIHLNKIAQRYN